MGNYKLKNDEVILFEGQVKIEKIKSSAKLTLTSEKMIFEQEKGIFNKKLKVIDMIPLKNIKIYKEKVQIKQKKSVVIIQTIDKIITFSCPNILEAKKIVEKIISIKTNSNVFERGKSKLKKAVDVVNDSKDIVLAVGGIVATVIHHKNK